MVQAFKVQLGDHGGWRLMLIYIDLNKLEEDEARGLNGRFIDEESM